MTSQQIDAEALYQSLVAQLRTRMADGHAWSVAGIVSGGAWIAKRLAHDLGLTKKQFEKLASKVGGENFNSNNSLQDKINENSKVLAEKWGLSAEAKYQETVNFAEQANAPSELVEGLKARKIDSETVLWLSGLAQSVSEKTQVSFQGNNANGSSITPDEAHMKIDEILNNPDHPYHRGDEGARRRYHDLLRQANPQNYQ